MNVADSFFITMITLLMEDGFLPLTLIAMMTLLLLEIKEMVLMTKNAQRKRHLLGRFKGVSSATFIRELNNNIFFPESTWFQDPALVITKHLQI